MIKLLILMYIKYGSLKPGVTNIIQKASQNFKYVVGLPLFVWVYYYK